jgi:beta-glucanase (GH16 family)
VFADEFNAGTLDRSRWNVEGPAFWVNNEAQAYVDSPETISFAASAGADGGALVLKPVVRAGFVTPTGRRTDFVSGRINTADRVDVTYGKVEARIRMPDAIGAWPAFWLLGYGSWPDSGEIDIMEYVGDRAWTSSAIHGPGYSGNTPLNQRQLFPAGQDATGWHVYAVDRTADAVVFSVDGREVYRVTRAMVEAHGPWRFDRKQYVILNFAIGGTYPGAVNGVTAPHLGLPQATVDKIGRGAVAMEVDWVRVWAAG